MANDLNQCQFIGRLGKAPETRYTAAGDAVCSFSIAVGSSWKDKNSGEKREATEWIPCSVFGKLAEICSQYLQKGSQVFVQGRFKTDKYTDKDGVEKYSTKINVDNMQMLGGKPEGGQRQQDDHGYEPAPQKQQPAQGKPKPQFEDLSDDIPF